MMKTEKKVIIKITSQDEENVKSGRRTLGDLQSAAKDKENLAGRYPIHKDLKSIIEPDKTDVKRKKSKVLMQNKSVQTGECTITAQDLLSNEPSTDYWKRLAEKRQEFLDKSLQENEVLKEKIATLKEENRICKEMLEESKHLVVVLKEMLAGEDDDEDEEHQRSDPN